jgi:hypothetical protein
VKRLALVITVLLLPASVEARHVHHAHYYRVYPHSHHRYHHAHPHHAYHLDLVTVDTAAGKKVTVARHLATRYQALIADFVATGYVPRRIGCYARSGHVRRSRHYMGAACDFDGSLSQSAFMRSSTAAAIIRRHGFRNGCSFRVHGVRDCGHVDDGLPSYRHRRHRL